MAGLSTAMTISAKAELLSAGHCFLATATPTASSSSSTSYTSVSSMAGIAVGMSFTGTNVGAGSVVSEITSSTAFTSSVASTGSISGGTLTFVADTFKLALFKVGVAGTYGAATVNYTDMTGNSDETSGAGYSAGGVALTNVSPTTSGTTGFITFSPNPSWTSATFSTIGALLYNTSVRLGGTSGTNTTGGGRALGVYDFGGTQSVSSGTLTVLMPAATSSTAVFRIQ